MGFFRYRLELLETEIDRPNLTLKNDKANYPFHISWRMSEGKLVLNSMSNGKWNKEVSIPFDKAKITSCFIEIHECNVMVIMGQTTTNFTMPALPREEDMKITAIGIECQPLPDANALAEFSNDNEGRLQSINLFGHTLAIPERHGPWISRELLLAPSHQKGQQYVAFLGSHPITSKDRELVVIDASETAIFNALAAALLMPQTKVQVVSRSTERDQLLKSLIKDNSIDNLQLVSPAPAIADLLQTKSVLLQGDDIFADFEQQINELNQDARKYLSIYTGSKTIVPANRVFPCANAVINYGKNWRLKHNSNTSPDEKRQGLDITIASYNSGDYLIDCTRSLLCDGREDIRVIIVDDGSTDGSGDKAATVFATDSRVRVERKPNGGCASARNYGRLVSDSTHIAFVDADDFVAPNFFAHLYDLSVYSGNEITQGGFDFYDESREAPYYPSYEAGIENHYRTISFGDNSVIRLQSIDIIKGQPTIWRKVYRRDFLDAREIYFPENVRAYDDYIFQILTLTEARDVLMMPEHLYHYRQHSAQDVKQGDERHFYMLHMFQILLRQSIEKSWPNFTPYALSIIDSINWSVSKLKSEFIDSFLLSSAKLTVMMRKVYGKSVITDDLLKVIKHPDFIYHFNNEWKRLEHLPSGAHWIHFSTAYDHPELVRMRAAIKSPK